MLPENPLLKNRNILSLGLGHQLPKGLKFSDNGDELGGPEPPPQNVYAPHKKADPKKKHKRKLAKKSKRKNRR